MEGLRSVEAPLLSDFGWFIGGELRNGHDHHRVRFVKFNRGRAYSGVALLDLLNLQGKIISIAF